MDRYCAGLEERFRLEINADKTKVVPWADYALQGSATAQMAWLQGLISATPDQESLRQASAGLNALLWLPEVIEATEKRSENPLALSRIALPEMDVRDETLNQGDRACVSGRFLYNRLFGSGAKPWCDRQYPAPSP